MLNPEAAVVGRVGPTWSRASYLDSTSGAPPDRSGAEAFAGEGAHAAGAEGGAGEAEDATETENGAAQATAEGNKPSLHFDKEAKAFVVQGRSGNEAADKKRLLYLRLKEETEKLQAKAADSDMASPPGGMAATPSCDSPSRCKPPAGRRRRSHSVTSIDGLQHWSAQERRPPSSLAGASLPSSTDAARQKHPQGQRKNHSGGLLPHGDSKATRKDPRSVQSLPAQSRSLFPKSASAAAEAAPDRNEKLRRQEIEARAEALSSRKLRNMQPTTGAPGTPERPGQDKGKGTRNPLARMFFRSGSVP